LPILLAGGRPILALDMFEHSYHIDYGAKSAVYVDAFMNVIRWITPLSSMTGTAARHLERSVHGPFESITIRQGGQTEHD
jgi:hypothetical protein